MVQTQSFDFRDHPHAAENFTCCTIEIILPICCKPPVQLPRSFFLIPPFRFTLQFFFEAWRHALFFGVVVSLGANSILRRTEIPRIVFLGIKISCFVHFFTNNLSRFIFAGNDYEVAFFILLASTLGLYFFCSLSRVFC